MPGKFGPWTVAALVGAAVLAVGFAASEALPRRFRAAGELKVPEAALRSLAENWPDSSTVNRWQNTQSPIRPRVQVEDTESSSPSLLVSVETAHAEEAADAVNAVLRNAQVQLTREGVRFAEARNRALLAMLHHARAERSRAQRKLDQLIFDGERAVKEAPAHTPAPGPAIPPAPVAPMVKTRNPLWDDLARQIGELEGRRAGLLGTMTPAHPVIHDLDWRISQLRAQLQASPEFTTAPDPGVVAPLPLVAPAPLVESPPAPREDVPDNRDAVRRQRFAVAAADKQLGFAIQQERDAWQQLSALRAELETCVQVAAVPSFAEHSPVRDPIRWVSAVVALLASGVVLWRARPKRQPLRTLDDVRRTLGVPVIGKLSAAR